MKRAAGALFLCLAVCGGGAAATLPLGAGTAESWRMRATPADRARMRRWRDAWTQALAQADGAELAGQGALFTIEAALADPVPPAGAYRCRTFRLGVKPPVEPGVGGFVTYPWFDCRITPSAQGEVRLVKLNGSQRQVGTIYPAEGDRAALLGTLMLGDEARAYRYGADRTRDVAGWVERIESQRWRVAMPYPAFESTLDVLELVPAG
ncbi:hypothetical protein ASE95_05565 [Sphingomonas sp. Leaf231]|uniref:DUF4893 domain-containing protein n=1 Tax=Sphingomonas sp. Leaf231 TaxID=1736301 RepID=UPI0006FD5451|nr:DUF4893 domain-containing protein [Sphingomonas sp. Leaf231]KQN94304.1 hypothetical protein ASE95_05565 [Sphingomonas sp. Leaf231]